MDQKQILDGKKQIKLLEEYHCVWKISEYLYAFSMKDMQETASFETKKEPEGSLHRLDKKKSLGLGERTYLTVFSITFYCESFVMLL